MYTRFRIYIVSISDDTFLIPIQYMVPKSGIQFFGPSINRIPSLSPLVVVHWLVGINFNPSHQVYSHHFYQFRPLTQIIITAIQCVQSMRAENRKIRKASQIVEASRLAEATKPTSPSYDQETTHTNNSTVLVRR